MINQITEILKIKDEERDFSWEERFFKALSESNVELLSEAPQMGPDNWPYLMVQTLENNPENSNQSENIESVQKLIAWLSERGIGLVVNPMKAYPDYVFTYGMLWGFRETGYFVRPSVAAMNPVPTSFEFRKGQKLIAGAPTEKYLPLYTRKVLKNFLFEQGVLDPKILVISADGKTFDLVFSLESLKNPPESEHAGIAEALSWFLPPDYSIVLMSEKNLPEFVSL